MYQNVFFIVIIRLNTHQASYVKNHHIVMTGKLLCKPKTKADKKHSQGICLEDTALLRQTTRTLVALLLLCLLRTLSARSNRLSFLGWLRDELRL